MKNKLPDDHVLRDQKNMAAFSLVIHDNGECLVNRDGYSGAEYYQMTHGFRRIREFVEFGFVVAVSVYCVSGDNKDDYYDPGDDKKDNVKRELEGVSHVYFDVGNTVDKDGGWRSMPAFYRYKDQGKIGFVPYSKNVIERKHPLEMQAGLDTLSHSSLYAN